MEQIRRAVRNDGAYGAPRGTSRQPFNFGQQEVDGMEKVLRLALAGNIQTDDHNQRPGDSISQSGQATLDLIHSAADSMRERESRAHALAQRAVDELESANARIQNLEARVLQAETRAKEAEKWIMRLQESLQDQFSSWLTKRPNGKIVAA